MSFFSSFEKATKEKNRAAAAVEEEEEEVHKNGASFSMALTAK